jgi:hypothetical protein
LYDYKNKNPGCTLLANWIWLSWARKTNSNDDDDK